ncbi:2-amino-4-hydroxy-6-hydroxymethyldihydropteridine pyrophosphokinase [Cypionkella aquatica]|uniref:2-amino-4-hydroxy-6-hydroxymethyldihydropteridine pyrophosphokinase n=1 Tax=Cypionkella aquatica TaxID=1756042 RepID=A0AA37TVE4_9RHOB|nr:2-amino-4-hydroxy-6-hydroxymethyldihydropteridine diphosphokinase [Cypionkella aquatica]GLS85347.1 2-amino-4-hydroxy-6-hydroxymethyldihydropteridine pyrophosphokinase [Cypionkella aquatica]
MFTEKHALIAFGANLNFGEMPPKATILAAIAELAAVGLPVTRLSNLYQTPCFPAGAGPDYVNAAGVVTLRHSMVAADILACLHRIEAQFGRERVQRWGMRSLDIDLLALGESVLPDLQTYMHWQGLAAEDQRTIAPDQLILPHPRLAERAFVLVPLHDVAPDWRHPITGLNVAQMLAALPPKDRAEVVPLPSA